MTNHIRAFPPLKIQGVRDTLAIGLDTTLSELRNNIAWHNGNILRIVLAAVMGGWDMDGFCDAVGATWVGRPPVGGLPTPTAQAHCLPSY